LEINIGSGLVRSALFDQFANDFDHLGNVLGRKRLKSWAQKTQAVHVFVEGPDIPIGDGAVVLPLLGCPPDYFIVDIGKVAYVGNLVVKTQKVAVNHVEYNGGARVSYMAQVIHGDPAHVHAYPSRLQRNEFLLFPGQSVIDLQCHRWKISPCALFETTEK